MTQRRSNQLNNNVVAPPAPNLAAVVNQPFAQADYSNAVLDHVRQQYAQQQQQPYISCQPLAALLPYPPQPQLVGMPSLYHHPQFVPVIDAQLIAAMQPNNQSAYTPALIHWQQQLMQSPAMLQQQQQQAAFLQAGTSAQIAHQHKLAQSPHNTVAAMNAVHVGD